MRSSKSPKSGGNRLDYIAECLFIMYAASEWKCLNTLSTNQH